jgi:hypothetical protein
MSEEIGERTVKEEKKEDKKNSGCNNVLYLNMCAHAYLQHFNFLIE